MKIKRNIKFRLYLLAIVFAFTAGFCACGKDDSRQAAENRSGGYSDNSGEASDDTYDVLSVDSVTGSDIDYGKYEVEGGNGAGKNEGNGYNNKIDDGSKNKIVDNKKNDSNNNKIDDSNNDNKNKSNKNNSTSSTDSKNKTKDNDIKPDNGSESKPEDTGATDKSTHQGNDNNINKSNNNSDNNTSNNNNLSTDSSKVPTCSLVIDCTVLLSNMDKLDREKRELVPEDGIILEKHDIEFSDGESAFDVLLRETRNEKIHMEYSFTPVYNSSYIEGIANLYEFDCGELSGWVYSVNDQSPNYGISKYGLKDGDVIRIEYTLER